MSESQNPTENAGPVQVAPATIGLLYCGSDATASAEVPPVQVQSTTADVTDTQARTSAEMEAGIEVDKNCARNATQIGILRPFAHAPRKAFAVACGCHCFLFLIFVIAIATAGKEFLNFSTGVALHLWENEWKIGMDAVAEGREICSYDVGATIAQRQQEVAKIPHGFKQYSLVIVFEATSGNMMTPDNLLKAKGLEDFVLGHPDYEKYCLREANSKKCKSHSSPVLACIPQQCGYYQNTQGLGQQAGCGAMNAAGLTPAANCDAGKSWTPGVFQCEQAAGCTRAQYSVTQDFITQKLDQYSVANFAVDYPETFFLATLDSSFGAGSKTAAAIRSQFTFGFPLEGYESTADRPAEQVAKVEKFMKDAYFLKLESFNQEQGDTPALKIGYVGGALGNDSISALIVGDFAKVFSAFLVVGIYMVLMTQSYFLTSMAMLQIIACFLTGFMVYRLVFANSFFGSFHIMALFLLLGVGVDDVFVMLDHFAAAALVDPTFKDNLWARISWTWKHATIAMGVTSSTTVIAFVMNATSSFPGIRAFGIFAGALVFCLYISMCFYFVAVVCCNHAQFTPKPFCCAIADRVTRMTQNTSPEAIEDSLKAKATEKSITVRFFENHFSYFILNHRIKILVLFLGASTFMFSNLAQLTPERKAPDMLPDDHPMQQYATILKKRFVRGGGEFNTRVNFVYGFDKEVLDREGTDPTGGGFGKEESVGTLGKVKWNPHFHNGDFVKSAVLPGMKCMVQLCDAAEVADQTRNTGGPPSYQMQGCWARDILNHLKTSQPSTWEATWAKITKGGLEGALEFGKQWDATDAAIPGWRAEMNYYVFAEPIGGEPVWRFFNTELKLTSDLNIAYADGNQLAENWKNWLSSQMETGSCKATSGTFWPFIVAADFHQFKVVETLMSEMLTSVITSIGVAFAVLILATGNIYVGFAAGFSIGLIVLWVMAVIPLLGWDLGMVENLTLVMVPGLSVDYVAHLAEAYNQAKFDDREHRVIHALEHSGVSIISGAQSTILAALCLMTCQITFFVKFGTLLLFTIFFSIAFSLFFFPSLMALVGPTGLQGDWHHLVAPCLAHEQKGSKPLRIQPSSDKLNIVRGTN